MSQGMIGEKPIDLLWSKEKMRLSDFYDPKRIRPLEGARVLVLLSGNPDDIALVGLTHRIEYAAYCSAGFLLPNAKCLTVGDPALLGWVPWPEFAEGE